MWLARTRPNFRDGIWPELDGEVRDRLDRFVADLLRFNRARNLVSRKDSELRVGRLVEECVVAGRSLEGRGLRVGRWADVGSGAGFPGLVLGALFPSQPLVLIERREGRCDFLRREVAALGLERVDVFEGDVGGYDGALCAVVLAKAVAPPGRIEPLCAPLLAGGGVLVLFARAGDPVPAGWSVAWEDPLPDPDSALRGLTSSVG